MYVALHEVTRCMVVCLFTFNQWRAEKGWFVTYLTFYPHWHAGLVYDVTDPDCWPQQGSTYGRVFVTFKQQLIVIRTFKQRLIAIKTFKQQLTAFKTFKQQLTAIKTFKQQLTAIKTFKQQLTAIKTFKQQLTAIKTFKQQLFAMRSLNSS